MLLILRGLGNVFLLATKTVGAHPLLAWRMSGPRLSSGKGPANLRQERFIRKNKCDIPPAGPVTPVTALQTLGLFAVRTGYIFISCTETGYNPIKTGVLWIFDRLHFENWAFDRLHLAELRESKAQSHQGGAMNAEKDTGAIFQRTKPSPQKSSKSRGGMNARPVCFTLQRL